MNKRYVKGRALEYKVKHYLETLGYKVIRAAGSHGQWDLVAIHPEHCDVLFIQCKSDKKSKVEDAGLPLTASFLLVGTDFKEFFTILRGKTLGVRQSK